MFVRKSRVWVFMFAFLCSMMLFAEGEVALSVKRSFSQSVYTPGEATTVTVTLDIDYTGSNKDYPENIIDNTEGYFIQVNYEEYIANGCSVLWGKSNFVPLDFKEKEKQEENNKILVTYDYHYEDDETGELVCRSFPLQYSYKVNIPATATGNLTWGAESNVILGYYMPADDEGTAQRVVTASYPVNGANVIMADKQEAKTYTVYYYSNNGSEEEPYKITELTAGEYAVLSFGETGLSLKDNCSFVNWNTEADGTGEPYAENANFTITDADVSFYAQWVENQVEEYEITYYGNGGATTDGSESYKSQKIPRGTEYALDANKFDRKYYSFAGWKDEDKNNVANTITVTSNVNLYAQWDRNQVTISYQPGEEAKFEAPLEVLVDAGSVYSVTTVKPQKDNSTFVGWSWNNQMVGDTIDVGESNINLVANWDDQEQATIVYHTGIGVPEGYFTTFSPKSKTVEYAPGEVVIAGSAYFYPLGGMAIKGWATEEVNNAPLTYLEKDTVSLEAGEKLDLYAIWEYYPDLTLAGIVRPDFDFNDDIGEEYKIFNEEEEHLNVSNSVNALGRGKVHANENAYLWFRMINYGFVDSGSFNVVVKLTKDGEEPVIVSNGTILRREFYEENLYYRTIPEDYNNGLIANGLYSDGTRGMEHVLVCLDMGKLSTGSYTVQVSLDANQGVEEVPGTTDNGVSGGGETDNDFEMEFTVDNYNEYDVVYHENADWFNGWNRKFEYQDQTKVLSAEEILDSGIVDIYYKNGFYFAEWNTRADGGGEPYKVGATVSSTLDLYAIWKQKSQLFFNPLNEEESVHNWRYISLSNSADTVEPADVLYANEEFFVNISIMNWSATDSGPFEVGLELYSSQNLNEPISYKEVSYAGIKTTMYAPPHNCCEWSLPAGQYRLVCIIDVNNKVLEYYEETVKENLYQIADENGESVWVNGYKTVTLDFTISAKAYDLTVDGGTGDGEYIEGTEVEIHATEAEEGKVFDHWEAEAGTFADANASSTKFTMPAQAITVTAIYVDEGQYDEWPEDADLYSPRRNKVFIYNKDLVVAFTWPKLSWARSYTLQVKNFAGHTVYSVETQEAGIDVEALTADSFIWTVTAQDGKGNSLESNSQTFTVMEENGLPVITEATGSQNGNITLFFDEGTADTSIRVQMFFYSLDEHEWTSKNTTITIRGGKATVPMGVDASRGYFYIRTLEKADANFLECVIEM